VSFRRYDFIVFSDDWGRHPSSCQHLFKRIGRQHRVLWVNTIGLRAPKADRFTLLRGLDKLDQWKEPLRQVGDRMWVFSPIMLPAAGKGLVGKVNAAATVRAVRAVQRRLGLEKPILFTSVPNAADYAGKLNESAVVYYVTDDYSRWPGGDAEAITRADRELTRRCDLIFACTEALADSHRSSRAPTVLLPHGVDFEHFSRKHDAPDELAEIPAPRACFFGLIYEKVDLDGLQRLAEQKRELQLVMIGPVKTNVDALAGLPNVHFLGPKSYQRLPAYLQAMDVILVPYVCDEQIRASGPLKIRECLAVGKPTVAPAIPSLRQFDDCLFLYENRSDFVGKVDAVLRDGLNGQGQRMRRRVQAETWEARVQTVLAELDRLQNGRATGRIDGCKVTVESTLPQWTDYLNRHPHATVYADPRWAAVMKRAYGNRPLYLTARRGGKIVGVLQLVEQKSLLFGSHLCSLPYFDASGILADDADATGALIAEAGRLLKRQRLQWAELRQLEPLDETLPVRTDKVAMQLTLPPSGEQLWNQLKAKVRNQIRKAHRSALTVQRGGRELLNDFHAVYCRNMRDLGSPPHKRRFFELIADAFAAQVTLFVVRAGRQPVAAAWTLRDRNSLHVPWAASDRRFKPQCPNMLLYWSMLRYACESEARCFDFGRSTRGSGTYRFKKQWGAAEQPLYWHYIVANGAQPPNLRPESSKYRALVACWRRLPVGASSALGPLIISKLS